MTLIAFRASDAFVKGLDALCNAWDKDRSQTIRECIHRCGVAEGVEVPKV